MGGRKWGVGGGGGGAPFLMGGGVEVVGGGSTISAPLVTTVRGSLDLPKSNLGWPFSDPPLKMINS